MHNDKVKNTQHEYICMDVINDITSDGLKLAWLWGRVFAQRERKKEKGNKPCVPRTLPATGEEENRAI